MDNSAIKTGILGVIIGLAVAGIMAVAAFSCINSGKDEAKKSSFEGSSVAQAEAQNAPMKEIKRDSVPVEAVDRVKSKKMKGEFTLVGQGEDAKWGVAKTANFKYTVIVVAKSEILDKQTLPGGEIKVTEIRTFEQVQDALLVSDVDFKLSLRETLPLKQFSTAVDTLVTGYASVTGDAINAEAVAVTKNYLMKKLEAVDGKSARGLLGVIGIKPTPNIEEQINKLSNAKFRQAISGVREISGKSYKITYYQKASGQPLYIKFTYADGSEVTDPQEQLALKRANAFIDYNLVPNTDCRPGDKWTIKAKDMQEVFDPYVDGIYTGSCNAVRLENSPDGDWVVQMQPGLFNVVNESGSSSGHLKLESGMAKVNPQLVSVNDLMVNGMAKVQKTTRHHLLFTARINGECAFQGRLITDHE